MELETEVSDAEVLKNILIHLDFSPVASVMKTRKYMKCGRFTACLDQVEGLGDFLELEVIAEQESERKEIYPKWKICLPYWDITCRTLYRLLISVCFRKN